MTDELSDGVLESLDCFDKALRPFIPYLLQDLWEIGSSSSKICTMISKNGLDKRKLKIMDIGCGKGAISIPIAKEFGAEVFGIDAMPEFIEEAKSKAKEWGVENLCTFKSCNARDMVGELKGFNLVLLASIGPVFGNVYETLKRVEDCLDENGYIILDDGYLPDNSVSDYSRCLREAEFFDQIKKSDFCIVDLTNQLPEDTADTDDYIYDKIKMRTDELTLKYPDKKGLFESYLKSQENENYSLENELKCVMVLLKKKQ